MIRKLLSCVLTLFSLIGFSQSVLGSYNFANVTSNSGGTVDPTPPPSVAGVSFSPFTAVGSFSNPNASFRFSFTNWPVGATTGIDTYSTFTGVLTPTAYYEVSLTPQAGYSVNLSSIVFSMRRSGTGVRNFAVRSSVDSYSNNLQASASSSNMSVVSPDIFFWTYDATSNAADIKGNTVTLGGSGFSAITNSVTFRFYAWNAEGAGGTFSIDSVVFFGAASNTTFAPVAIQKNEKANNLKIFPNPSRTKLVTVSGAEEYYNLQVVDVLGRVVIEDKNISARKEFEIDLRAYPAGAYFIKFQSEKATRVERLVITD